MGRLEFHTIEFLQLLNGIHVDGIHHVHDLNSLFTMGLLKWRGGDCCNALTGDVINIILALFHSVHILLEADLFVARLRSLVTHQLRDFRTIRGVFVNTELRAFAD